MYIAVRKDNGQGSMYFDEGKDIGMLKFNGRILPAQENARNFLGRVRQ